MFPKTYEPTKLMMNKISMVVCSWHGKNHSDQQKSPPPSKKKTKISKSGHIIIFHRPRFPWNKGIFPSKTLPFGGPWTRVRSRANLTRYMGCQSSPPKTNSKKPLKLDGWKRNFFLGRQFRPIFRGELLLVSRRVGLGTFFGPRVVV